MHSMWGGEISASSIGPALDRRLVYAAWFEGLLIRSLGPRLTPALIADLREAGVDLSAPLAHHYASTVRLECLRLLREQLFSDQNDEQAWHALGRAAVDGFLQTLVGHAFALVFRLLGPRALMKRSGVVMSSASNYVSAEAFERAPFRWEVHLEGTDLPPAYYAGLVLAALELCKADNPQVLPLTDTGGKLVLSCIWAPPISRR